MKNCKAILIDPFAKTVTALHLSDHDNDPLPLLADLYKLIGTDNLDHNTLQNGDSMWCDDNGLLKDWSTQAFFLAPFCPTPLAGKVVVLRTLPGIDQDTMADCKTDIELLRKAIQWVAPKAVEVPAPTISERGEDGTMSAPEPLDGGAATWTYANHPGKEQ